MKPASKVCARWRRRQWVITLMPDATESRVERKRSSNSPGGNARGQGHRDVQRPRGELAPHQRAQRRCDRAPEISRNRTSKATCHGNRRETHQHTGLDRLRGSRWSPSSSSGAGWAATAGNRCAHARRPVRRFGESTSSSTASRCIRCTSRFPTSTWMTSRSNCRRAGRSASLPKDAYRRYQDRELQLERPNDRRH